MVVWIGIEEFLYKGNVGFLGEIMSKFMFLFWPSLIQIESFKFLGKLDF